MDHKSGVPAVEYNIIVKHCSRHQHIGNEDFVYCVCLPTIIKYLAINNAITIIHSDCSNREYLYNAFKYSQTTADQYHSISFVAIGMSVKEQAYQVDISSYEGTDQLIMSEE